MSPHDNALLGVLELLNNIGGPFDSFDEELIVVFAAHASVALDRARLVEQSRRSQAIEASLQIARDIQRGFMPGQLADIVGYDVATWWFPQQAVGGDYCDVLPLRSGRHGLVIADVSGHGLGPSLLMASTRAALRRCCWNTHRPKCCCGCLAESLARDLVDGHFITMVVAVLDPVAHTLRYANAGHAPALHYIRKMPTASSRSRRRDCRWVLPTSRTFPRHRRANWPWETWWCYAPMASWKRWMPMIGRSVSRGWSKSYAQHAAEPLADLVNQVGDARRTILRGGPSGR